VSPFQKILGKFLATNTLQTVCPWLGDVVAQEYTSADDNRSPAANRPSFVYCPPLHSVSSRPLSTFVHLNHDARAVERVFGVPVAFFWETLETGDECFPDPGSSEVVVGGGDVEARMETTMSLVSSGVFRDGKPMMAILSRVLQTGLSVAGVRLLYPTVEQIRTSPIRFITYALIIVIHLFLKK